MIRAFAIKRNPYLAMVWLPEVGHGDPAAMAVHAGTPAGCGWR